VIARLRRRRPALLAAACALVVAGALVAVFLVRDADSSPETTSAQYFARVAAVCRIYGPKLDRIRPPDVAEPANVIAAVSAALPLITAQERDVRALEQPPELRARLRRWLDLVAQRRKKLEEALRAGKRQDFRALGIVYIDFVLAGPKTARAGSAVGSPHPPC
jgi:hypothetical protein